MTTIGIGTLLTITGLICTLAGLLIGFFTFRMKRDKEVRSEASKDAVLETKIDNISRLIDSMVADLKANEQRWTEISLFVARLDEKLNHADEQIDTIKKRENQKPY